MRRLFSICPCCGKMHIMRELIICDDCRRALYSSNIMNHFPASCEICGYPLLHEDFSCPRCRDGRDTWYRSSFTFYRGIARQLISLYKFSCIREISVVFAEVISSMLEGYDQQEMVIIPIPCSWKSLQGRGWDQMYEIGRLLGRRGFRVLQALERNRDALEQKDLGRADRLSHAQSLFSLKNPVESIAGVKRIILLDDVITTGATMRAAGSLFVKEYAVRIEAMSLVMD